MLERIVKLMMNSSHMQGVNGVINPLHVRWKNRKKEILYVVDGTRRLDAAEKGGLGSVPIVNHGFLGGVEALTLSVRANLNQKKLSKREQVTAFRRLRGAGVTVETIAEIMAIDKRTVSDAIRVEEKAAKEMRRAAAKPISEGGVSTRVAARATSLPKKEQKELVAEVKGKSTQIGLRAVRRKEIKLGKKHPGRKSLQETSVEYKLAPDVVERCKAIEEAVRHRYRLGETRALTAQLKVIECLKGNINVTDIFEWDNV